MQYDQTYFKDIFLKKNVSNCHAYKSFQVLRIILRNAIETFEFTRKFPSQSFVIEGNE